MQTQAPSPAKILIAVGFALSCFALLLFLWITFGGSVPFKPRSYQFKADFPEAITLQKEADVRIGGVSVGKVKQIELAPDTNASRATIEIEPEYAPISSDAKAILRQKTLLGETYVELTTGTQVEAQEEDGSQQTAQAAQTDVGSMSGDDAVNPIEEGGQLDDTQVIEQVQIDEIFNALDQETRRAFRSWMRDSAIAVEGRGLDLNDSFGNIGPFSEDASDVLGTLRRQDRALRTIISETGEVFEALTEREQELAGAITGSNATFRALASRDEALAETFRIFPTFERESRLTLDRLDSFAKNANPLFRDLKPVARDLSPTLRDLRRLAPNARRLFRNLNPLITASKTGLPALRDFLDELKPVMVGLDPFLSNLNPIVRYLDYYKSVAADFLANPSAATSGHLPPVPGQSEPRHLSRQLAIITNESLAIYPTRLRSNRGNGYLQPGALGFPQGRPNKTTFPSHDCDNTGATGGLGNGQVTDVPPSSPSVQEGFFPLSVSGGRPPLLVPGFPSPTLPAPFTGVFPGCIIAEDFPAEWGGERVPRVFPDP